MIYVPGGAETAPSVGARASLRDVAVAAAVLVVLSGGPSVAIVRHAGTDLSFEGWAFALPFGLAALGGASLAPVGVRRLWQQQRVLLATVALYVGWMVVSVSWSVVPNVTATRGVVEVGVVGFAVWLASLSWSTVVKAVAIAMTGLAAVSLLLILVDPARYTDTPQGRKRMALGLFANGNSLGPVCALGLLACVAVMVQHRSHLRVLAGAGIGMVVDAYLLVQSRSETAMLAVVVVALVLAGAWGLTHLRRLNGWVVASAVFALVPLGWCGFFANIDLIAARLGTSSTLSSRRLIWADVRQMMSRRPWRGYGYFAVWDDPASTLLTYEHVGKAYGSAHNGLLEVGLGLGRVGMVLVIVLLLYAVISASRGLWQQVSFTSVVHLGALTFVVSEMAMESFTLWHSPIWVLFLVAVLHLTDGQSARIDP